MPDNASPKDVAEQLAAYGQAGQVAGNAPDAAQLAASGAMPGETDVARLLAAHAQLQDRIDALEDERRSTNAPPVIGVVQSLRDLLSVHAGQHPADDHSEGLALADDLADAAKNAVKSGDLSAVRQIGDKVKRYLDRNNPGSGDHPYYAQARDFAGPHLDDALADLSEQSKTSRPASTQGSPKVLQGSVTG